MVSQSLLRFAELDPQLCEAEVEKPRFTTFADGSELEQDDLGSMHNCINTEVRFRALLTHDEIRQLEVVRV